MSNISGHFAVPLYTSKVIDPAFTTIQNEFDKISNVLKQQDLWQKHPIEPNAHSLTDVTFSNNFLDDWNLTAFQDELHNHVIAYMQQIGTPYDKIKKYRILNSWMTQTLKGEYAPAHTHGGADLSGVYYYKTTGDDGDLYFNSPNTLQEHAYCFEHLPAWYSSKPEVGKIVLFPGWIRHGTKTNTTRHERISLSFNIVFDRGYF